MEKSTKRKVSRSPKRKQPAKTKRNFKSRKSTKRRSMVGKFLESSGRIDDALYPFGIGLAGHNYYEYRQMREMLAGAYKANKKNKPLLGLYNLMVFLLTLGNNLY
jgi:hypothetical protein